LYTYIWEYYVKDDFIEEFEKVYGHDAVWMQLFKRGNGYNSTEPSYTTVPMKEGT